MAPKVYVVTWEYIERDYFQEGNHKWVEGVFDDKRKAANSIINQIIKEDEEDDWPHINVDRLMEEGQMESLSGNAIFAIEEFTINEEVSI